METRRQGPFSTRRQAIAGAAVSVLAGLLPSRATAATQRRPNILWLVSEDNNPFIGAYGDKLARTPTLDRLARGGLLFRHAFSNAPVCAPSRFGILTGVYPEACAPANHMRANAPFPSRLRTYPELLREAGYFCTNNAKTDYNCDVDADRIWDISGEDGHWRKRPADAPFMAVFNYGATHESQLFRPTAGSVQPAQIDVPPYLPDTPGIRRDFASYYNLMERMDGQIAQRLAELEADGLADDTIIFYYSDNGGSLPRSKRYCYDEGLRCALIVHVPPRWQHLTSHRPGSEVHSPVSFIDLAPTLLSLVGLGIPAHMQGSPFLGNRQATPERLAFGMRNRMDEVYDFTRTVTDGRWRYIRNYMPHRIWGMHGAFQWLARGYQDWESAHISGRLNKDQDRFFEAKPFEELYDLSADPHELANLSEAPEARAALQRLRRELDAHMLSIRDNGFIPEAMAGEGYEASKSERSYPLRALMKLAAAAGRRDPDNLSYFEDSLESDQAVVRYWAAMGLLILGPAAEESRPALEQRFDTDPSLHVQIVLSEALAKAGDARAVAQLGHLASPSFPWQIRLQALNSLTALGAESRPVRAAIAAAAEDEQEYVRNSGRYLLAVLDGSYVPAKPVFDLERMYRRLRDPSARRE